MVCSPAFFSPLSPVPMTVRDNDMWLTLIPKYYSILKVSSAPWDTVFLHETPLGWYHQQVRVGVEEPLCLRDCFEFSTALHDCYMDHL